MNSGMGAYIPTSSPGPPVQETHGEAGRQVVQGTAPAALGPQSFDAVMRNDLGEANKLAPGLSAATEPQVCSFFVRTGTCAYGTRCKFVHPADCPPPVLNSRGYPLRASEPDCAHYRKKGWCAFGMTCKFNHPELLVHPMTPVLDPSTFGVTTTVVMPSAPSGSMLLAPSVHGGPATIIQGLHGTQQVVYNVGPSMGGFKAVGMDAAANAISTQPPGATLYYLPATGTYMVQQPQQQQQQQPQQTMHAQAQGYGGSLGSESILQLGPGSLATLMPDTGGGSMTTLAAPKLYNAAGQPLQLTYTPATGGAQGVTVVDASGALQQQAGGLTGTYVTTSGLVQQSPAQSLSLQLQQAGLVIAPRMGPGSNTMPALSVSSRSAGGLSLSSTSSVTTNAAGARVHKLDASPRPAASAGATFLSSGMLGDAPGGGQYVHDSDAVVSGSNVDLGSGSGGGAAPPPSSRWISLPSLHQQPASGLGSGTISMAPGLARQPVGGGLLTRYGGATELHRAFGSAPPSAGTTGPMPSGSSSVRDSPSVQGLLAGGGSAAVWQTATGPGSHQQLQHPQQQVAASPQRDQLVMAMQNLRMHAAAAAAGSRPTMM